MTHLPMIAHPARRTRRWPLALLALPTLLTLLALGLTAATLAATPAGTAAAPHQAPVVTRLDHAPVLAAVRVGPRIVAVGDHGLVMLADDGQPLRQAARVPTRTVLTSLCFIDARQGWAAGHDGTVLGTTDGGETWTVLREEPGKERALLSVWFENARHGLAVGQFGLVLETQDGGASWQERRLVDSAEQAEKHLMQLFAGPGRALYIAAENGTVFRSSDAGGHWQAVQTDNKGSFWTGLALADGSLLVAGLRGHLYRSEDSGAHWHAVASGTQQSITAVQQLADGSVTAVGLSGAVLHSQDQGRSWQPQQRADRANITALVDTAKGVRLFSLAGGLAN